MVTAAGRAFLDNIQLAPVEIDAAVEAARKVAPSARKTFANTLIEDGSEITLGALPPHACAAATAADGINYPAMIA